MMPKNRYKLIVIEGIPSCNVMLVGMFMDEEQIPYVELSAWHDPDDMRKEPFWQMERMYFDDDHLAEKFIKSYPQEQAYIWAKKFYDKYVNKQEVIS
jgi:hypothetical protein